MAEVESTHSIEFELNGEQRAAVVPGRELLVRRGSLLRVKFLQLAQRHSDR